ncbi:MAG TPA: PQQ-dependent sugar dehydrogenase [Bryobacteraceae bacterium]|jgi:glucose/arabinose dehydrogenase|nr:PQQ-dependent sugar dehydrogenase [Bryobacteraceae bacterium]
MDPPSAPVVFDTAEQHKIRVTTVVHGLEHPWAMAFLPDGGILITERPGRLRLVRDGALVSTPLSGIPKVHAVRMAGLLDVALHPKFAENRLVYFTYSKPGPAGKLALTLARGRYEKTGLADVRDLFSCEFTPEAGGSRIAFAPDGAIFMTTGDISATDGLAQNPASDYGKILRLKDDGTIPPDNPLAGKPGYKPEIYSMGHRDQLALTINPLTGAVLNGEAGPMGGDRVNLILPGKNYGWPLVSYGRAYDGSPMPSPVREGIEPALITWEPGITPSGMVFYTGDRFPAWKGNLFVGGLRRGEIPGTGSLERVVFNAKMWEVRREAMLTELHQRIRDVRQGPDGLLYVLTEEENGALLRIEPSN